MLLNGLCYTPLSESVKSSIEQNNLQSIYFKQEEEEDVIIQPLAFQCESTHQIYFTGALYVVNGLLLLFGAFLAWETRKVRALELSFTCPCNNTEILGHVINVIPRSTFSCTENILYLL